MLNLKKGLALVIAAATAFTFAPVANLGHAVSAEAATERSELRETHLTADGDYIDYHINYPGEKQNAKFQITSTDYNNLISIWAVSTSNSSVTDGAAQTSDAAGYYNNGTTIRVIANTSDKAGDVTLTLKNLNGVQEKQWVIHVDHKSDAPKWTLSGSNTNNDFNSMTQKPSGSGNATFNVKVDTNSDIQTTTKVSTLTVSNSQKNHSFKISSVSSSNTSVVQVYSQTPAETAFTLKFLKTGTSTLRIQTTDDNENNTPAYWDVVFNVAPEKSVMKIGDNEIVGSSQKSSAPVKTIALTEANSTAEIGATLKDAASGEKLVYSVYRVDKDGKLIGGNFASGKTDKDATDQTAADVKNGTANTPYDSFATSNDITVDQATGKITATANALNNVEQYYAILVHNNLTSTALKATWIRVVSIRNSKVFTQAKVTIDGTDYEATAKYNAQGDTEDATTEKPLTLSTQDFKDPEFTALANGSAMPAGNIKSSDTSVVEVSGNKLLAKKVGTSVVTFDAKSDTTHYGNATVKFNVTVTDKYIKAKIDAADITLTNAKKTDTIKATSTPATTYTYTPGNLVDGKWVEQTNPYVTVDKTTGKVTFNGNGYGSLKVRITGAPVTGVADAFVAKDITINYTNLKESALKVSTKTLSLSEGETGSIVVSGAALSYASSDEDVATVDATGTVTAVAPGTAVITVSDAGNDTVAADQDVVIVTVKAATQKPAKVTGLKVSNKKGAYVSVKWTNQGKNINYRVYKKVGNGKWVGKNVAGSKTTLSVKKGAKVQVKVKSYVKDANGKTTWGPAATKAKTFKTDKK